jgi:hypothetical protein
MDEIETRAVVKSNPPPEKQEEFLAYVQKQIARMQGELHLGDRAREITFFELNYALRSYQETLWVLISLYSEVERTAQNIDEEFENWYADKFLTIRSRENSKDISAGKWAAAREIEMMVRKEHGIEYSERKKVVLEAEQKKAFIKRLLDGWQAHQFILSTLSKNVQSEAGATGFGGN